MRKIKFRAWDIEKKEIFEVVCVYYDGGCKRFPDSEYFNGHKIKLMQFTGLKDKNGKEIYEGDIVKVPDHYQEETLWESYIGIIKWIDCAWTIEMFNESLCEYINEEDLYKPDDIRDVEVIGNIYENKELLEDEEDVHLSSTKNKEDKNIA